MVKKEEKRIVSGAGSFYGWNFKDWFKGNWKTIKEGLKIGLPLIIGWASTHNPALTGVITLAGKFVIDCGEYYFKEYTE